MRNPRVVARAGTALLLGMLLAGAAAIGPAGPAGAYTLQKNTDCGNTGQNDLKFADPDVTMVLHYGELNGDATQQLQMVVAVGQVVDQFNEIGGTTAHITVVQLSTDPFTYKNWYGNTSPTIHVGFVGSLPGAGEIGETKPANAVVPACTYTEAHMAFLAVGAFAGHTVTGWNFNEPNKYYAEGSSDYNPYSYFRPWFLHELLHAFGLAHSAGSYAFMDYGDFPWANRPAGDRVRPLPDDVRAIRHLYPDTDARTDVALLNTWFDTSSPTTNDAVTQRLLCKPSRGQKLSSSMFETYCGSADQDPTEVCPGDTLQAQFAIANYSTMSVDTTVEMFFSLDDTWDGTDLDSVTSYSFPLTDAQSARKGRGFVVPDLTGAAGTYYTPIMRLVAVPTDGSLSIVSDWIPLRGDVRLGDCA